MLFADRPPEPPRTGIIRPRTALLPPRTYPGALFHPYFIPMKILSPAAVRTLDAQTIAREPISSRDLMKRAALTAFERLRIHYPIDRHAFVVLCGPGNNGGDGWVIAEALRKRQARVQVWEARTGQPSPDNAHYAARYRAGTGARVVELAPGQPWPAWPEGAVLVDALFGAGLNRPVSGYWAGLIDHLSRQEATVVAIDLPSGLFADRPGTGPVLRATRTFSFQLPKLAFFAPAAAAALGAWELLDIGLHAAAIDAAPTAHYYTEANTVRALLRPRRPFDHKGTFGHALLLAGSRGKMGAAILCARATLRAGAGLVTAQVPRCGYEIMQIAFPEAMCRIDRHRFLWTEVPDPLTPYRSIAAGPGLGTDPLTAAALRTLLERYERPLVLDADALNLLAQHPDWLELLPAETLLTPHPKEFERLFGATPNDFARWERLRECAQRYRVVIVLKMGYTAVAFPDGTLHFNPTGNPGMGTGGTGDVLTGVLAGLLAQGYSSRDAALLGVYLHGSAGDLAAAASSQESLLATDVIDHLGAALRCLRHPH